MRKIQRDKSHMPTNSVLYDKVIPIVLIGIAVLTALIILAAVGILLGLVPY